MARVRRVERDGRAPLAERCRCSDESCRVSELAFRPHSAENRRACATLTPADASDHRWSLLMPFLALHVVLSFLFDLS